MKYKELSARAQAKIKQHGWINLIPKMENNELLELRNLGKKTKKELEEYLEHKRRWCSYNGE